MNYRIALCLLVILAATSGSLVAGPCDPPTPVGTPCDDGDLCTTGDTCNTSGQCVGSPLDCDTVGDVQCMINTCDPATGCVHTPRTGATCYYDVCAPLSVCTSTGYCGRVEQDCSDGNPCTFDWCRLAGAGACRHDPINGTCEVGLCAGGCASGTCQLANPAVWCDDGNVCTEDLCDPAIGCFHNDAYWHTCDADHDLCTATDPYRRDGYFDNDQCQGGVCVPGPLVDCNDGNNCTSEACSTANGGCDYTSNGICGKNPEDLVYWQRLCESPPVSGEFISQQDVDCVKVSCTFAAVATAADVCDRLNASPHNDKCEQAEAKLMALLLNVCRGRTPAELTIRSHCSDHTTVGQSRAEADGLLCSPLRDAKACTRAACMSEEINSGKALRLRSGGIQVVPIED